MRRFIARTTRAFATDQRGVALVEMALVTPFMLTLSAGVFEFSNILHTRLLIEAGVEDAARYIARCSDPQETCESRAKNIAVNGAVTGGTARVSGWTSDAVTMTYTPTPAVDVDGNLVYRSNTANVEVVDVSTTYAYPGTGLWSFLGFGTLTLSASHEERIIGW
jgi:Flp pilus assembly protein TadG